ncbi:DUF5682 family protein, partial [Streptomyces griseofuscus]|uniref:DUF5682 family protein n=1 Tax=Streptomyces griseofuscus TaxID=146922 RepID=UPI00340A4462
LGEVPESAPAVPLQRDLGRQQRSLRLRPEALERELELDLRGDTDAGRSRLLHRLRLLGIGWGELGPSRGSTGTFRETWRLRWEPELSVRVAEAGVWGTTVAAAARARAEADAADTGALADVTALAERCLLAGLPDALPAVMRALADRAALDTDVGHLAQALPALVRSLRYGDVRGTDTHALSDVAAALAERVFVGLPPACTALDSDAAEQMRGHVDAVHTSVGLLGEALGSATGTDPGAASGTGGAAGAAGGTDADGAGSDGAEGTGSGEAAGVGAAADMGTAPTTTVGTGESAAATAAPGAGGGVASSPAVGADRSAGAAAPSHAGEGAAAASVPGASGSPVSAPAPAADGGTVSPPDPGAGAGVTTAPAPGIGGTVPSVPGGPAPGIGESMPPGPEGPDRVRRLRGLRGRWRGVLRGLAGRDAVAGVVRGRAVRLLMDEGELGAGEAARLMGVALSRGTPPVEAAAWIEGFVGGGGGLLLVHDERLLGLVDSWLTGVPAEAFTDVLPLLRRTFAAYEGVRRTLGELVRRGPGEQSDPGARGLTAPGFGVEPDAGRADAVRPVLRLLLGIATEEKNLTGVGV